MKKRQVTEVYLYHRICASTGLPPVVCVVDRGTEPDRQTHRYYPGHGERSASLRSVKRMEEVLYMHDMLFDPFLGDGVIGWRCSIPRF